MSHNPKQRFRCDLLLSLTVGLQNAFRQYGHVRIEFPGNTGTPRHPRFPMRGRSIHDMDNPLCFGMHCSLYCTVTVMCYFKSHSVIAPGFIGLLYCLLKVALAFIRFQQTTDCLLERLGFHRPSGSDFNHVPHSYDDFPIQRLSNHSWLGSWYCSND